MGREVAALFLKSSGGGLCSLRNWINSVLLLNKQICCGKRREETCVICFVVAEIESMVCLLGGNFKA